MARKLTIHANGQPFSAYPGDLLLDAALHQGIDLPHDCRAGQCGSCRVRILRGEFLGGRSGRDDVVHACQARVFSDAHISYEKLPQPVRRAGKLARIVELVPGVCGLTIKLQGESNHRPGQYYRFKFRGFPARCFSPTAPFVGKDNGRTLRLHVKIVRDGEVSSRIGTKIRVGHRLTVEGPFGSAFFRPDRGHRLILVASGTGFAPIWGIAEASLRTQPGRPLLLVAGARRLSSLYMVPALCRLSSHPAADFIATAQEPQNVSRIVRCGTPDEHLPPLNATDLVYAAGSPRLVEAVGHAAARADAEFYADPFLPSSPSQRSWFLRCLPEAGLEELKLRLANWLSSGAGREGRAPDRERETLAAEGAYLARGKYNNELAADAFAAQDSWRV